MDVLLAQVLIAGLILAAHRLVRWVALALCLAATVFTLGVIEQMWLKALQLLVIWGAYSIALAIGREDRAAESEDESRGPLVYDHDADRAPDAEPDMLPAAAAQPSAHARPAKRSEPQAAPATRPVPSTVQMHRPARSTAQMHRDVARYAAVIEAALAGQPGLPAQGAPCRPPEFDDLDDDAALGVLVLRDLHAANCARWARILATDPDRAVLFWANLDRMGEPLIADDFRARYLAGTPDDALLPPAELGQDREAIRAEVERRGITSLVHVTRAANLASILRHGLLSIDALGKANLPFIANDGVRLDGRPQGVALSVMHPNARQFGRWQQESGAGERWVVLLVDPAVLWEGDALFCPGNAAGRAVRTADAAALRGPEAFRAMMKPAGSLIERFRQNLRACDPCDVEAEVLALQPITPDRIFGVVFDDPAAVAPWRRHLGHRLVQVEAPGTGLFGPRGQVLQPQLAAAG